jgi:ribonuclease G
LSNELIISATQNGSRIALLKDKQLVEFHEDQEGSKFVVGDIYLGSVKKVVQGLNAAFIDIGYEKDAFLHYLDLGPQYSSLQKFTKLVRAKKITGGRLDKFKAERDIDKHGKITQQLSKGLLIPVQVVKEPISTKGPRLSSELSIAGRYLVLVPFSNTVSVSKKISSSDERKRLQRLIQSIKPEGFGVIIRTVAEGKETAELDRDLRNLVKTWDEGMTRLTTANGRDKLIGEINKTSSLLRDLLNESFDNIHVDDKKVFDEVKGYIHNIAPEKEKIVKLYAGKAKIFEHYGIEKQIKSAFGQTVSLRGGGYLIIEHTEALHVIDVNSGNKSTREESQETTALSVNVEAAKEIARQLRLRDMGGIIVVDFIDMKRADGRSMVYKAMKDEMGNNDRAKHTVLPLSKFGLMQITRERVRPQMNIITKEVCPTCNGTGSITASILITDQIEHHIEHLFVKQNERELVLALHPFLYAYYTKGFISKRVRMFFKYNRWVKIVKDSSLGITEFHFLNKDGEEIDLHHKKEAAEVVVEKPEAEEGEGHPRREGRHKDRNRGDHPRGNRDQRNQQGRHQQSKAEDSEEEEEDENEGQDADTPREENERTERQPRHDQRRHKNPRRNDRNRGQRNDQRNDQGQPRQDTEGKPEGEQGATPEEGQPQQRGQQRRDNRHHNRDGQQRNEQQRNEGQPRQENDGQPEGEQGGSTNDGQPEQGGQQRRDNRNQHHRHNRHRNDNRNRQQQRTQDGNASPEQNRDPQGEQTHQPTDAHEARELPHNVPEPPIEQRREPKPPQPESPQENQP